MDGFAFIFTYMAQACTVKFSIHGQIQATTQQMIYVICTSTHLLAIVQEDCWLEHLTTQHIMLMQKMYNLLLRVLIFVPSGQTSVSCVLPSPASPSNVHCVSVHTSPADCNSVINNTVNTRAYSRLLVTVRANNYICFTILFIGI